MQIKKFFSKRDDPVDEIAFLEKKDIIQFWLNKIQNQQHVRFQQKLSECTFS